MDAVLEGLTFQKLHHNEGLIFVIPNLVNDTDVGLLCSADTPIFNFSSGSYMQFKGKTLCCIVNHLAHTPLGQSSL